MYLLHLSELYLSFSDILKVIMTKATRTTDLAELRELSGDVTTSGFL